MVPSWWNDLPNSIRVLSHIQESTKNTSLPFLFDPQTLALSILILFDLCFVFYLKKKKFEKFILIIPFRILIISKHVFDYHSLK